MMLFKGIYCLFYKTATTNQRLISRGVFFSFHMYTFTVRRRCFDQTLVDLVSGKNVENTDVVYFFLTFSLSSLP